MKTILYLILFLLTANSQARQKIFHQRNADGQWQYLRPFADKSYVLALHFGDEIAETGMRNTLIYFGKTGTKADHIFWKEQGEMKLINDNISYEDYNGDGVKDILIFENTGARGGNSFYNLFLVNPKNYTITKVDGFNKICNPEFNKKHQVIVGYGLSGENYFSIYRIGKSNKTYQIGKDFKETEDLDLDDKIAQILKKRK